MTSTKKRLLIFIDWFYPGYKGGGPIQSCFNLVEALSEVMDIYVVTSDRDLGEAHAYPGIETDRWLKQDEYQICYLSPSNLRFRTIRELMLTVGADHVYLNGMYSRVFSLYPLLVNRLGRISSAATVTISPRGMLLDSALNKKKYKKKIFLWISRYLFSKENIRFHATNEQEKNSVLSYYHGRECFVANNLGRQKQPAFQGRTKVKGELALIFIARIEPIKNLELLLEALKSVGGRVSLTIVGPVEDDAYWFRCKETIGQLPGHVKVEHIGPVPPMNLEPLIRESHMFTLLSKGENFGHSICEALLCGRPVLVSDQTPWKDLEAKEIGFDMPLNDPIAISTKINEAVNWDQDQFNNVALHAWKFASSYVLADSTRDRYINMFA